MINWDELFEKKDYYRLEYLTAKPFPHIVITNLCDIDKLNKLYDSIPDLKNKSRDFIFAGNKFEKSRYYELGDLFSELYNDLKSPKMNSFLSYISNMEVFVDPKNHGGGLHQGKENSYLDMHLDYNYHPLEPNWWREMNLLLYLNRDWKKDYGGQLKLRDLRTDQTKELNVNFNTLIIQKCDDYTLHGYDRTNFPPGVNRTSIATYAFTQHVRQIYKPRTTDWFPDKSNDSSAKKWLGRNIHKIIHIKNKFFGSATAKNG